MEQKVILPYHVYVSKQAVAGGVSYQCYKNGKRIAFASSLGDPNQPITISNLTDKWKSAFDREATRFPGLKRYIEDASGDQIAFLRLEKDNSYTLGYLEYEVNLKLGSDGFVGYCDNDIVIEATLLERAKWTDHLYITNSARIYEVEFSRSFPDLMELFLLSFFMIQF